MPKLMYISTSHTKGIYCTAIVQCAAACKWLQSGSGQVDAFLTGLVDASVNRPRDAPTLVLPNRHVANYSAHREENVRPFTKATPRKTNERGKKRGRSMILTDTPVKNALEAGASKVKRTTSRKVARTLVSKKEVKPAKRQKDTE